MELNAGNPFCPLTAIQGAFTVIISSDKDWIINSGQHRLMPDHYVYVYDGGKVTSIYKRKYASPMCLAGYALCPYGNMGGQGKFL